MTQGFSTQSYAQPQNNWTTPMPWQPWQPWPPQPQNPS